jgi:hypothetical protein
MPQQISRSEGARRAPKRVLIGTEATTGGSRGSQPRNGVTICGISNGDGVYFGIAACYRGGRVSERSEQPYPILVEKHHTNPLK